MTYGFLGQLANLYLWSGRQWRIKLIQSVVGFKLTGEYTQLVFVYRAKSRHKDIYKQTLKTTHGMFKP